MKREYLDINVYDALQERFAFLFQEFVIFMFHSVAEKTAVCF